MPSWRGLICEHYVRAHGWSENNLNFWSVIFRRRRTLCVLWMDVVVNSCVCLVGLGVIFMKETPFPLFKLGSKKLLFVEFVLLFELDCD